MRLIETDSFPFEFLSKLAERESWRKEVHRPIYFLHKWWAKRLGTVFRGLLLSCMLKDDEDLQEEFYRRHDFKGISVFDPFMGSGTTVGEAHKLGFTVLGRDINPVAVQAVHVALGPLDKRKIEQAFRELSKSVGHEVRGLYRSTDSRKQPCDVLYYFWVMQTTCAVCGKVLDLFPSYVIARNAYPKRKPEIHAVCPACGDVFKDFHGRKSISCRSCEYEFDPDEAPAKGAKATCPFCSNTFTILDAVMRKRPPFRLYAKLILTEDGEKKYLAVTDDDLRAYAECSKQLHEKLCRGSITLPNLALENGYNTRQAMSYGFFEWRDFFNDRQLLALSLLQSAILQLREEASRNALLTLFSGVLEFNNLFASYKGEGTGAVRHMFSHHILKPERTPIEANLWGTPKSSGSFSNLFRSRLLRAIDYREAPTEVNGTGNAKGVVCSRPFTGELQQWGDILPDRGIALSCGDSSGSGLPNQSINLVVTDPPFYDNVHYSELADFFFAWQQIGNGGGTRSTRSESEVQDTDSTSFGRKLKGVFAECCRILKNDGLLVFTYHHSRDEGWQSVADAVLGAGFIVVNSLPVKSEMSVAAPKSQAKEPIQFDIVLVCRKVTDSLQPPHISRALECAISKVQRLESMGFKLSRNDKKIVLYGQALTTLKSSTDMKEIASRVEAELTNLNLVRVPNKRRCQYPRNKLTSGVPPEDELGYPLFQSASHAKPK